MKKPSIVLAFVVLSGASARLYAQTAATQAAVSPAPAAPAITTAVTDIPLGTRVGFGSIVTGYDDGGRRDPFSSLVAARRLENAPAGAALRPKSGLASLALADVTVRGIVKNGTAMLAILEGPNKQSFVARLNDRISDATIQTIDRDGVVFLDRTTVGTPGQTRKSLRPAGVGEDVQ